MTGLDPAEADGPADDAAVERSARIATQLEVIWAFAWAFGALATGDFLLSADVVDALSVGWAFGLGAGAGATLGVLFGAAFARLASVRPRVVWGVWLGCGGVGALALARALGAFSRLGTAHHGLALLTLAGATVASLGFGAVCAWAQPRMVRGATARTETRRRGARSALAMLMLGFAGAGLAVERTLFPGNYPAFHFALLFLAQASVALSLLLLRVPARPSARLRVPLGLALIACIALPLATLDAASPRALALLARVPVTGFALRLTRRLLDFDGDGYAARLGGGDCAPFRPTVHPGAAEVPDNGVDDNCVLGDGGPARRRPPRGRRR